MTIINRTCVSDELAGAKTMLLQMHIRTILHALLCGFAGVAPRSVTPNLIELLSTLLSRFPAESRAWISEILFSVSASAFASFLIFLILANARRCIAERFHGVESRARGERKIRQSNAGVSQILFYVHSSCIYLSL